MEVVVEMEEMETVAHDLTRLVVEGRPGTQARSRAGLDAFFSRPRRCTVPSASGRDFGFGPNALHLSETAFCPPRNRPSPPNRFASRHLYQFQERSCCPPIPRRTLRCWVSGGYKRTSRSDENDLSTPYACARQRCVSNPSHAPVAPLNTDTFLEKSARRANRA